MLANAAQPVLRTAVSAPSRLEGCCARNAAAPLSKRGAVLAAEVFQGFAAQAAIEKKDGNVKGRFTEVLWEIPMRVHRMDLNAPSSLKWAGL